ncbi:MAG: hypothetical protein AMXMBFR7_50840 [Planctomycetota bacterium]
MKIVFVTRMLAAYRAPIYERCLALGHEVCVVHFENRAYSKVKPPSDTPFRTLAFRNWLPAFLERRGYFFSPFLPLAAARERGSHYVLEGESNLLVNLLLVPLLRVRGCRFVWWSLGALPGKSPTLRRRLMQPLVQCILRRAEAVACYSRFGRDYYADLGIPESKLRVAYNALGPAIVYRDLDENRAKSNAWVAQQGWENRLRITYIGAIVSEKRPELLIEAAAEYQKRSDRKLGLCFVGEGAAMEACRELAQQWGVDACFVGRQDRWAATYILAGHAVAIPGLGGLAINHAMMLGRPVICGPADGTERDLVLDGQTGCFLATMDKVHLAEALLKFDAGRDGLAAMGERAKAHVDRLASLDALVAALVEH